MHKSGTPVGAKNSCTVTFRCERDVLEKLDELCRLMRQGRRQVLSELVVAEFDRIQGNPELKKVMEQMNELSRMMEGLMKASAPDASAPDDAGAKAHTD